MKESLKFNNVLFLIFLTLKLTGTITWSWWWVTAPLWLPITVVGVGFLIFLGVTTVIGLLNKG